MDQLYTLPKHLSCHWGGLQVLHSHHTTSAFTPFFRAPSRPLRALLRAPRQPPFRGTGGAQALPTAPPPPRQLRAPPPWPWPRPQTTMAAAAAAQPPEAAMAHGPAQAVWRWRAALGCPRGRAPPALLARIWDLAIGKPASCDQSRNRNHGNRFQVRRTELEAHTYTQPDRSYHTPVCRHVIREFTRKNLQNGHAFRCLRNHAVVRRSPSLRALRRTRPSRRSSRTRRRGTAGSWPPERTDPTGSRRVDFTRCDFTVISMRSAPAAS